MIERFLKQTSFTSQEDYIEHLEFIVPDHFNFAYDVMEVCFRNLSIIKGGCNGC